jgi:5-methylcytosine-specific restriction endonuclease McrA
MASEGGAYCPEHTRPKTSGAVYDRTRRKDDPALARAATIRGSARWQRLRDYHRHLAPVCCDPFGEHRPGCALATEVHHVEPIGKRPDLAFRLENLVPLCTRCHARVERMERSGQPTRHLFTGKGVTLRHLCNAHEGG